MHHWLFIESSDEGLLEKQDFGFFAKNLFFNSKLTKILSSIRKA
jgi:hypothetical protein